MTRRLLLTSAGIVTALVVLVVTAWVCDDAYITFRAVDNVASGIGPRWNPDERVQAFTHPLWFLLLAVFRLAGFDLYLASIVCAIALTLVVIALVPLRLASGLFMASTGLGALLGSKAFVDFSTSGLENPLTHVLLCVYFVAALRLERGPTSRALMQLAGAAALLMVTRLDAGLLVVPSLLVLAWRHGRPRALRSLTAGFAPLAAWTAFSIAYYGFPVPNTAYAKLATGIPQQELWIQGWWYLRDSLARDPVTLPVIVMAAAVPVLTRWRHEWPWSLGVILSLGYVVHVGGDFMTGRFLTAPFVAAVCQLVRLSVPVADGFWPAGLLLLGLGALYPDSPYRTGLDHGRNREAVAPFHGIFDERAFYYPRTGLLPRWWSGPVPFAGVPSLVTAMKSRGQRVVPRDSAGYFGYLAGRDIHVVDTLALADPLLARLPAESPWRIGHFGRRLPPGYMLTLRTGVNRIEDPGVARFYDDIREVTRGSLWTRARWKAVVRMNLGRNEHLLEGYRSGYVGAPWSRVVSSSRGNPDAGSSAMVAFDRGLVVYLPRPTSCAGFAISLRAGARYRLTAFLAGRELLAEEVDAAGAPGSVHAHEIRLPGGPQRVDRIQVTVVDGVPPYSAGQLDLRR